MANAEMQTFKPATAVAEKVYPEILVSFHTETACYHARASAAQNPNNQIISTNTQKSLDAPAGQFMIDLVGDKWLPRLTSNDVVVIQMGYTGKLNTVMVGLIDRVQLRKSVDPEGRPSINTHITGRDFGKLFVKNQLKFYPEISGKKASEFFLTEVGWLELMKVFTSDSIMKGTPATIIDIVMRYLFPKLHNTKWSLWNETAKTPSKQSKTALDIVRYQLQSLNFFMPFIFTADQYEGALWNLMERATPKPFAELFIDVRSPEEAENTSSSKNRSVPGTVEKRSDSKYKNLAKGKGFYPHPGFTFGQDKASVVLVLRETPYDTSAKSKLVQHTIPDKDVIREAVEKSDDEHYNLFWAGTTINPLGIDLKRVSPPLLNEADAYRYGLSPLEVEIQGLEITDGLALEGLSKTYTGKLKEWFQNNHNYLSGTVEIKGKGDIRVGQLAIRDEGGKKTEYYIESVEQNFTVFDGWSTSLQVVRGMGPGTKIDSSKHTWTPPKKPEPKPAPKPSYKYHTVVKGDTLWALAGKYYGRNTLWPRIWEANKEMMIARDKRNITMPGHWIYPGQKLKIPM